MTNDELLCEYYICQKGAYGNLFSSYELARWNKNTCDVNCTNTQVNKVGCTEYDTTLLSGQPARSAEICNGVCDVEDCEDEAICNGFTYGIYCKDMKPKASPSMGNLRYLPPLRICDGIQHCALREDEADCKTTKTTGYSCQKAGSRDHVKVPIHNFTRCTKIDDFNKEFNLPIDIRMYCHFGFKSQINCSDPSRIGVSCEINGFRSTVSKQIVCHKYFLGYKICDDDIDKKCLKTKSCNIHKHNMCNNVNDCVDMADETDLTCKSTTKSTCQRRVGIKAELPIPISWLKDGVRDCENGADETGDWPKCGVGKTWRYLTSRENECRNVFICKTGDPGYVELENLCDGLETCGNENKICSISNRPKSVAISVATTDRGFTKTLSYCFPGLRDLEQLTNTCVAEKFQYPDEEIFGVDKKTEVISPNQTQSCDYMYGEQYLYTSCTGHCISAICPLRNKPRYEACPSQFPDRVGTIVNNEYLIFLTKSYRGTVYSNRYFVCDDKIKCIDYSRVCNLVYDCEDGSDEIHCKNHFKCNTSNKLLPKTKKCDGHIDCFDQSDECNEQCSKEILEGYLIKGLSWTIGLLAILANFVIIGKSIRALKRCKTSVALINRFLILVIALGDFFVGCYLFIIATYDAIIFKRGYCQQQISWITSLECSVIGVFSTIGSQISLFSMTCLSMVRIYGIWNSMRIPGEVTVIKTIKIVVAILSLAFTSTVIAVLPIVQSFEDFFVNGVKFSDQLKIFVGTSSKATLFEVIQGYYGRTKDATLDWKMLNQMVKSMFSRDLDYEDIIEKVDKVDFYGNDGVCLFKYFVQNDDPQRLFVWSILALNFACFLFISVSYVLIAILSHRSSESLASSQNNQQIAQRNRRMNQRIAIIIMTDFLCWIPFIVICMLHSLEVINATPWYSIFSMVILPINSVINPFLYDDTVTKVIKDSLRNLTTKARNSTVSQKIRRITNITSEEMPTEGLKQVRGQAQVAQEHAGQELQSQSPTGAQEQIGIELQSQSPTGAQEQAEIELQSQSPTRAQEQTEIELLSQSPTGAQEHAGQELQSQSSTGAQEHAGKRLQSQPSITEIELKEIKVKK